MRKLAVVFLVLLLGCGPSQPPGFGDKPQKTITSLDDMQGTWKVLQVVDPEGNSFEGDVEVVIKANKATSENVELKLEFTAENTLKIFDKDKQVGEVQVAQTLESPIEMLWTEKATKQQTLLQKKNEN